MSTSRMFLLFEAYFVVSDGDSITVARTTEGRSLSVISITYAQEFIYKSLETQKSGWRYRVYLNLSTFYSWRNCD